MAIDDALIQLATLDPRKSHVVQLRFFGGLSMEEIAEASERLSRNGEAGLEVCKVLAASCAERRKGR